MKNTGTCDTYTYRQQEEVKPNLYRKSLPATYRLSAAASVPMVSGHASLAKSLPYRKEA